MTAMKERIPPVFELQVCSRRKCGWRGTDTERSEIPHSTLGPGCYLLVCPDCGNDAFYVRDSRTEPKAKPTPVQAFRALHGVWLSASHRSDMNEQMDALAKALRLDPMTLKPPVKPCPTP